MIAQRSPTLPVVGVASGSLEIERKFLVRGTPWHGAESGVDIRQGYLSRDEANVVRVRVTQSGSQLTIKGKRRGITCAEFEYAIPIQDGGALLELCRGEIIHKTRYALEVNGSHWDVDVFHAANRGLVIAEIELECEDQVFEHPDWLAEEVSGDPRYLNSNLSLHPYARWR